MHDLAEPNPRMRITGLIYCRLSRIMEYWVAKSNVQILTVSQGLAKNLEKRTNPRLPISIVYNIPKYTEASKKSFESIIASNKLVYFGQITPDRINFDAVNRFVPLGYVIDIYGYFSGCTEDFEHKLLAVISKNGGQYFGAYKPGDDSFLSGYLGCILVYESSLENIRYCMPNKLFQSLSAGLVCIVSDNLVEASETFCKTNFVISFSKLVRFQDLELDAVLLDKELERIWRQSKENYLSAVFSTRSPQQITNN
jgi:hypothetical protein